MQGDKQILKAYKSILSHDFEQAIEWFEQAIEAEPDNATYHYKLSITYARSNKLHKALEHALKAVELETSNEQFRFHLQHLQAKELIQRAEKYFDQSMSQLYLAITLLKEATRLDPLSVEAYLLLGTAYAGLEDYHLALEAIHEALRLDPQHEIAKQCRIDYQRK